MLRGTLALEATYNPTSSLTGEMKSPERTFNSNSPEFQPPIVLQLEQRTSLDVIVIADPATRLKSAVIDMAPIVQGKPVNLAALAESNLREYTSYQSTARFTELLPGRYALGVRVHEDLPLTGYQEIEVQDGYNRIEVALPPVDPERSLRIHCLGPDGEKLRDVEFHLECQSSRSSSSRMLARRWSREGCYLAEFDSETSDSYFDPGSAQFTFLLSATSKRFGTLQANLTPGQRELTLQFQAAGSLELRLTGFSEDSPERVFGVRLEPGEGIPSDAIPFIRSEDYVDANGVRTLERLAPGSYQLTVLASNADASGYMDQAIAVHVQSLRIQSGSQSLAIPVPQLYPLEVHWGGGKSGSEFLLETDALAKYTDLLGYFFLDEQLRGSLPRVPAGRYFLACGGVRMPISVPCGPVEFRPDKANALLVQVYHPAGFVRAGLQQGDFIVAADGQALGENPPPGLLEPLLQFQGKAMTVTVIRNGVRLEVPLTSESLAGETGDS
ncbi:MAG: hypothetical protein R3E96_04120 [Planctomycetota bacterium]